MPNIVRLFPTHMTREFDFSDVLSFFPYSVQETKPIQIPYKFILNILYKSFNNIHMRLKELRNLNMRINESKRLCAPLFSIKEDIAVMFVLQERV